MRVPIVCEVPPGTGALLVSTLPTFDYRDAHEAEAPRSCFRDIDGFMHVYFRAQPGWLRTVSMNQPSRSAMLAALEATSFSPGQTVGSWKVYARDNSEIVFGEEMGLMTYRFSMRLEPGADADRIVASTVAKLHGAMGKLYFRAVRLVHKHFVRLSLKNALSAADGPVVLAEHGPPGSRSL